jgi:hypothetical protein
MKLNKLRKRIRKQLNTTIPDEQLNKAINESQQRMVDEMYHGKRLSDFEEIIVSKTIAELGKIQNA